MFSYYGTKKRLAPIYPKPKHGKIIEPFAGAAQYSLLHFENEVTLIDSYSVIIDIWKYLQQCSPNDILSLPNYENKQTIDKDELDCIEQFELIRFLVQEGTVGGNKAYSRGLKSYDSKRKNIANSLFKIKHWKFECKSYTEVENELATWFIDPPYQFGGHKYKHSNKKIDFEGLADYCKERQGLVIVCENTKADWLPFIPAKKHKGINNDVTIEAIWSNEEIKNKTPILF